MNKSVFTSIKLSTILITAGIAAQAHASGYHFGTQSVSSQATANSSAAEAADPSTIFYNPAGLTKLEGTQATINLNLVVPSIDSYDQKGYYPTDANGQPVTNGKGEAIKGSNSNSIDPGLTFAPHAYASHQINDRVSLGLGVFVPFGSGTEYERDSVLRYNLNELGLQTIAIQPTVAFKLNDQHSFAVGLVAQNTSAELRQYANFGPAVKGGMQTTLDATVEENTKGLGPNGGSLTTSQLIGMIPTIQNGINAAEAGIKQLDAGIAQAEAAGATAQANALKAQKAAVEKQLAGAQTSLLGAKQAEATQNKINSMGSGNGAADGHAKVKGDDWGFGYNLAWMWDINDAVRVGVNYRSKIEHNLKGHAEWYLEDGVFNDPNLGGAIKQSIRDRGYAAKETANVKIVTPESLSMHGMWKVDPKWNLFADATWTRHSRFNQAILQYENMKTVLPAADGSKSNKTVLNPNWKDTWKFGVGASYQITEPMQLRFGLAYDQSPVRSSQYRMSTLPDNDRIWFSVGGKYDINKHHSVNVAYSYIYIKDADAQVNGYGTDKVARGPSSTASVSSKTNGSAKFDSNAHILGVQYTYKF